MKAITKFVHVSSVVCCFALVTPSPPLRPADTGT